MSMFVYTGMDDFDAPANESILTMLSMESMNTLSLDDVEDSIAVESIALEGINIKGVWESITGMTTKLIETISSKASAIIEKSTMLKAAIDAAAKGKAKFVGALTRAGKAVKEFFTGIELLQKIADKFSDLMKSGKGVIVSVHNKFKPATDIDASKDAISALSKMANSVADKIKARINEANKATDSDKEETETTRVAAANKLKTICDTVITKFKGFCNLIIAKAKALKAAAGEMATKLNGKLNIGLTRITGWFSACISFLGGCFFKAKDLAVRTLQSIRSKNATE